MSHRKPASKKVDKRHRSPSIGIVRDDGVKRVSPKPNKKWLKRTKERWSSFWASPVSKVIDPGVDGEAAYRLFTMYDERERCYRSVQKERWVKGSMGQRVENPMAKAMRGLDREIIKLEDRLGVSARARLNMGLIVEGPADDEPEDEIDRLNREMADEDDDGALTESFYEDDPREAEA